MLHTYVYSLHNPAARSLAAPSLADDASSQHSSDQSDTRTEHSDEDVAEKTLKRGSTAKTAKKSVTVKTEVHTHTHSSVTFTSVKYTLLLNQPLVTLLHVFSLLASNQGAEEASKEKDHHYQCGDASLRPRPEAQAWCLPHPQPASSFLCGLSTHTH